MSHFSSNELIFNKVGDEIISAGFGINSILLNKGLSPILSFTNHYDTDHDTSSSSSNSSNSSSDSDSDEEEGSNKKKVFRSFKNLAIPLGLFLDNTDSKKNHTHDEENERQHKQIPNDIYDELLKLVYYNDKEKRQTKKNMKKDKYTAKAKKTSRTYKKNKI
jgi:hypothetical protein